MDTTITISSKSVANKSDFLHLTYNTGKNEDAIISVDSSNFGQSGSVTWDKKSSTLSNIEKVTNWMKQSDKECVKSDFTDLVKNNESEAKSLILVRCDFNKSTNAQSYYPSPFNRSTSLINYFKNENVTLTKKLKVPMTPKLEGTLKLQKPKSNCFHLEKEVPYSPLSKADSSFSSENKSENMDEGPPSPESRKKELCHYLQLMNPADKKEIIILQNRRSTRVRNLAEQKQVQEKLKEINEEINKEKSSESSEKAATLKSFKELNIQINKPEIENESDKDYFSFPFPPEQLKMSTKDFDDIMTRLIPKLKRRCRDKNIPFLTTTKKDIFKKNHVKNNEIKAVKHLQIHDKESKVVKNVPNVPRQHVKKRIKTLRSNGKLKDIPIKKLIDKNKKHFNKTKVLKGMHEKLKSRKLVTPPPQKSPPRSVSSHCEIVSVGHGQDDDLDLEHFMDDMVDFDKLSDEHKKCLIESRILSTNKNISLPYNMEISPLFGFSKADTYEISQMCEKYKNSIKVSLQKDISNETSISKELQVKKDIEIKEKQKEQQQQQIVSGNTYLIVNIHTPDSSEHVSSSSAVSEQSSGSSSSLQDHDYASAPSKSSDKGDSDTEDMDVTTLQTEEVHSGNYIEVNTKSITNNTKYELLPYKTNGGTKSLHKSLQFNTKKNHNLDSTTLAQEWDMHSSPKQQLKKQSHFISISSENGSVMKAFYVSYNLIICQEFLISFWMQTPLGNVLGSQNMWIPRGQTQRIVLNNRCIQKDSSEKVVCTDTSVLYIELWMKEHKSEMRQGPVADVFVTLYYWKQRQNNGLDKKVLQLENINGFADDVQYCVMKNFPKIIVSWHSANEETTQSKRTFIHAYQLASDYQTVSNIYEIEPVDHYVSSLHNIEDYDDLIMGCGENKITLWNIEFGHIIATVELNDIKTPLSTLWVKCDRGFLFALQQCVDRELRLVAINGIKQSWKKLASYFPPEGFDRLKGVCIENGLLISFYDQGILCWNTETGEPVEEINIENDIIPSGTHVILVEDNQIIVKHALTHLMSLSVEES